MSAWWWAALGAGSAGALLLGVAARILATEVAALRAALEGGDG